jgi:intracellular sulfur oxidation DsrE/DsrF family protein
MNKLFSTRRKMMLNSFAVAALGALAATASRAAEESTTNNPENKHYKAAFQVTDTDPQKWRLTLGNAHNLQNDLGAKNVTIEIIAFGPGIAMFKLGSECSEQVVEAVNNGIVISVCENSMRGHQWKHEDMLAVAGYVPSGVSAVVQREAAGYAYVRS